MNSDLSTILLYFFSTGAQSSAAIAAISGAMAVFRYQLLLDQLRSEAIERESEWERRSIENGWYECREWSPANHSRLLSSVERMNAKRACIPSNSEQEQERLRIIIGFKRSENAKISEEDLQTFAQKIIDRRKRQILEGLWNRWDILSRQLHDVRSEVLQAGIAGLILVGFGLIGIPAVSHLKNSWVLAYLCMLLFVLAFVFFCLKVYRVMLMSFQNL